MAKPQTSATSGGVLWIPNHGLSKGGDSREQALEYLNHLVSGNIQRDRLEAFVDQGPEMVRFLQSHGIAVMAATWPDYFPETPGARAISCETTPRSRPTSDSSPPAPSMTKPSARP